MLEKELQDLEVLSFEPMTDYARNLFKQYREVRAKVLEWRAVASEKRAEVSNRHGKVKEVELGAIIVYRARSSELGGGHRGESSYPNRCESQAEKAIAVT